MPASRPATDPTAPAHPVPSPRRGAGLSLPRYAGLAATTLMALLSWTVGALPWQHPRQLAAAAPLVSGPAWHRLGLGLWAVAAAVLVAAWWLMGREARAGRTGPGAVVLTALLWALPLLFAAPLASHDVYSYACQGQAYLAGADPYRVGPASLPCRWLTAVPPIWRDQPAPYGPVAVGVSAAAAAYGSLLAALAVLRLAAVAGLALVAAGLPVLARRCGADPATALWLGLANPVVLVHLIGGAHHDALMAGLVVAGLALAARGRIVAGAAAVGLAVAVKATAVVVLPFVVLLGVAAGRRWPRAVVTVGAAAGATFAAVTLAAGLDVGWATALPVSHQPVSWMSPPSAVGAVLGAPASFFTRHDTIGATVEAARAVALYALLPAAFVVVWRRAARAGGVRAAVTGAGVALAATVVLAPVVYPWYAATPAAVLAAAAGPRLLRGTAVVVAALSVVVLSNSLNLAIVTRWPGAVVEVAALGALAVWALRHRRRMAPRRRRETAGATRKG
ncbi:polyprenol phosphomannose-dependent alpha 1,6 mannosyltransferase MptB [Planosporangium mesophilum]|uniref:DUF2029 domain-containing protein n=1 Tax=Planosporangium mesophilum TaxID=689768 RepID=A0A8J3TAL5_9ACTN|nr:polyprenol phosphomannose-dependent alpha 1,6 mannosyltransferase MptB [Planosporangium mesophilum]NJC83295.1 polyprenol phosphomannose-dependent alpha 1,6 mannosyltransferase MptB [Planosporangium mesophilum]GII21672.1 hypothetical protein Pme01_12690 [Planosporangium mesophilum]